MFKLFQMPSKKFLHFLSLAFILSAHSQVITGKIEKDFREDARIKVAQAAKVINLAVDAYEKTGPLAFVNSFENLLSRDEKSFIIKELKGLPPFPRLRMQESKLVVFYKKEVIAELDSYEVAQGKFKGGPFDYTYDSNQGFIENIKNWKLLDSKSEQSQYSKKYRFIVNLLIPRADARMSNKAAIPLMICGPLLGGLVGYWLAKPSNSPKVAQSQNYVPEENVGVARHGTAAGAEVHGNGEGKAVASGTRTAPGSSASLQKNEKGETLYPSIQHTPSALTASQIKSEYEKYLVDCKKIQDKTQKIKFLNDGLKNLNSYISMNNLQKEDKAKLEGIRKVYQKELDNLK